MANEWKTLIQKYADGRQVCNCGDAYLTNCGTGRTLDEATGEWVIVHDYPCCQYGCQANLHTAKDDIAMRVLLDLGVTSAPPHDQSKGRSSEASGL